MIVSKRWFVIAGATLLALSVALQGPIAKAEPSKLKVVATTGMIGDAAKRIGGDAVTVRTLMGPGVDPHAYRQTRTDIVAMTKADLVLWHGLYLEAQLQDFMRSLAKKRKVVAVAEALPKNLLLSHDDYKDKFDPHVWMAPKLWSKVILAVRDALIEELPAKRAAFEANSVQHLEEVAKLANYTQKVLASVPAESRILLTAHDAFNYFGTAYGFEVIGIQGISTESEAGLRRVAELVDTLVSRNIKAVFVESSVSDRNVRAVIEGAAARGHKVEIGGELFSDAMGPDGTYEGSYIGMIDHNATTITHALGGKAPDRGMSGRLSTGS